MKKRALAWGVLLGLGAVSLSAAEDREAVQLEEVVVEEAPLPPDTTQVQMPAVELDRALPADAGEALRSVVGVTGSRMGGHGIDPIIRGQGQTRLNILLDGAYIHGGCPNRMDPPTAYSAIDTYDEVEVIKGFQSVVHGGGGSGGTVVLTRNTSRFSEGENIRARGGAGYMSNSETKSLDADVTAGGTQGFARGIVSYADAGNYEDGDGNSVRSAYTSKGGTLILGWTPDDHTRLEGSFEATREDDVLFAGAGMDSPMSDSDNYRLKYSRDAMDGVLSGVNAEIYRSEVEHLMDNYSLRTLTAPMKMRVPTTSDTTGGRLSGDLKSANGWQWTLGGDYQRVERNADRFAGPASGGDPAMLQSVMWPGADLKQPGLFAEALIPVGIADRIKAGLRYDHVEHTVSRADDPARAIGGISTPNQLYQAYYGTGAGDHEEDNLSGFLRYEHSIGNGNSLLFGSLARSLRTADATERYLAANATPAPDGSFPSRWVGNPHLEPEQHLQLEIGLSWDGGGSGGGSWGLGASAFYDDVDDYILRDRAHGQAGILRNDNATIYRNVSARLWGLEAEATMEWASHWSSRLGLAYVNARNTTDSRWIAQTPPLEGSLGLDHQRASWSLGANLRFAAEQTKVDDDINTGSGEDAGETDGWAALDLYGDWAFSKHAKLEAGVNNVFDTTYAYHVNRANVDPFNPQAIQVNEPGRAFWVRVAAEF